MVSQEKIQAQLNIGVVGHVDHGKTSLTSKLTNKWTDTHSEELKQGISIKLGYADASFYKDTSLEGINAYTPFKKHPLTQNKTELVRKVSFVDAPGHETLMAVMLSCAALFDSAILVVAANERCPQPRTLEHLTALKMHGVKNIVVAQNKIDLVSKEDAKKNYQGLKKFLEENGYKNIPIIPTSAHFDINLDALIYALVNYIPLPKFNKEAPLKMQIVRSFDINKPGTDIKNVVGGVLGGAIFQGELKKGDKYTLYPGIEEPMEIEVKSLNSSGISFDKVGAGGLIAVGTDLDPIHCYSDKMIGQVVCDPKVNPIVDSQIKVNYNKFERILDTKESTLKVSEKVVLIIGSAAHIGIVAKISKKEVIFNLARNAVYFKGDKIAISRNIENRWRLSGYGEIK